ncbi:MAG: alpha-amylase family glycosyl hydrolase [Candidatus Eisenbacteria bacterium]
MRISTSVTLTLTAVLFVLAVCPCHAAPDAPLRLVTFTFEPDRDFDRVFLAGTFNEWSSEATEMREVDGHFEVTLPLSPGDYQYKFVADAQWITDEKAAGFHPDGYGGMNSVILVDDSFPPLVIARGDGEMLTDGFAHGQNAMERELNDDGSVTLRMRAWAGDVEGVEVFIKGAGEKPPFPPAGPTDSDGTHDYFEITVGPELANDGAYAFRVVDGESSVFFGSVGAASDVCCAGWFEFDVSSLSSFSTPDWIKEGVIYQIFPERFANGDATNDPDFSEWYYKGLGELPPSGTTNGEYFHLVDDWYDHGGLRRSPYKTDGKPDWNSFYGGDIEGVRQNLSYLYELGVTVIYFNPIFTSKSNHKYDAASYLEVDPHFGTNEEFRGLVDECHEHGMRVIIDLAVNHTGHTYWAFVDGREKGSDSEYWNWYEWKTWPVPGGPGSTPENPLDYYDCWWGFGQMPNLNFDLSRANPDEHSVRDLEDAVPNRPLVDHLLDVTEFWLADMDIDGYRLDVAGEVPFWFWELFRERVRETKPDAYILGELWGASPDWVNGKYFDAVMNYKFFRDPVLRFICRGEITATQFDRELAPGRHIYPEEGVLAQMNLIGSHDTERFLTTAGGDLRRLELAALFAMTYVGAPAIYYGDEIGMEGAHDPDCRRPFDWKWGEDAEKAKLHNRFSRLAAFRKRFPVLVYGGFETLVARDRVYSYRRRGDAGDIVVVMNVGLEEATVTVPLGPDTYSGPVGETESVFDAVNDLLHGTMVPVRPTLDGVSFTVTLPPLSGSLYVPHLTTGFPAGDGE